MVGNRMTSAFRFVLPVTIFLSIFGIVPQGKSQTYQGKELVKAELVADTTAIVPEKKFTAGLLLRMAPGWHTYWKFSGDAGLPTEIKWKLPPGWKVGEIRWPIPLKTNDPGDIQTYGYQDEVLLMQEMIPPAKIDNSPVKLSAEASWLVCERICIPGSTSLQLEIPTSPESRPANTELFARFRKLLPQDWPATDVAGSKWNRAGSELRFSVTNATLANYPVADFYPLPEGNIVVGHPRIESRTGNEITFSIPIESASEDLLSIKGLVVFAQRANGNDRAAWRVAESGAASPANAVPAPGVLTFLFFGFLGGLILNLMPCVLPVISLKIFGFIQQAGQSRQKILRSGLAFAAGIFAWFVGLALLLIILKAAGREVTWGGFQFTNSYFVLLLSVIVLVFALNLFGVFEISLPQTATRGLLSWSAGEGGAGSFFQGVFATVLATPCTAPFLGTALGFAFTQSAPIILSMFVAIAAGMSAPYLLLCAQPAWLRFLPKPGPWMVHVKQFMGFLLVVSIACWMKGAFIVPDASMATRCVSLLLIVLLVVGSGIYFIGDKFRSSRLATSSQLAGGWQPFTPERLQGELEQGRSVFVDFTAAWCLTCKFNEASVLESSAVREAFQRRGVVKLKADWTNGDPVITKLLQQFGRPGVPLYVLYPGKNEEPIVFPELLTKSMVLEKLETISPNVASQKITTNEH